MDIELFQNRAIKNSIAMIGHTDIISIELHGTKESGDKMFCPRQFVFKTAASWRACEELISSMLAHPA